MGQELVFSSFRTIMKFFLQSSSYSKPVQYFTLSSSESLRLKHTSGHSGRATIATSLNGYSVALVIEVGRLTRRTFYLGLFTLIA